MSVRLLLFFFLACVLTCFRATGEPAPHGARLFRDIFRSELPQLSDQDVNRLLYLPSETMQRWATLPGLESPAALRADRPNRLHEATVRVPFGGAVDFSSAFLSSGPVTILFFPGITVEFSASRPFEEVLARRESIAANAFRSALASARSVPTDLAFDMNQLSLREVKLDEMFDIVSLDGADGRPRVVYIYVKPVPAALESLGDLPNLTTMQLRRVDKLMGFLRASPHFRNILGPIFLSGYSRGVSSALEFLAHADEEFKAIGSHSGWYPQVRGVVSIAGTIFGSRMTDSILANADDKVLRLARLAEELEVPGQGAGPLELSRMVARNTARWTGTVHAIRTAGGPQFSDVKSHGLDAENVARDRLHYRSLFQQFNFNAFEVLNLDRPFTDYFGNVRRFKFLMRKVVEGLRSLTTETRLGWWKAHTLPPKLKYYSLLATMGSPTIGDQPWFNVYNPLAYGSGRSLDFVMNRDSYYSIFELTGESVNDGAVEASSGLFSPRRHRELNPAQESYESEVIGVLGTHHWGTVMPYCVRQAAEDDNSTFPRTELLRALGTFLAVELSSSE